MKYILIFLFCFPAMAKMKRFLVPCSDGSGICNIGSTQTPKGMICQVQSEDDGSLYDVTIVEIPDGFIGNFLDLIGLGNDRPWAPGEVVARNERIVCEVNGSRKADKIKAREDKEKADKTKRDKKQSDWQKACGNGEIHPLICEKEGF